MGIFNLILINCLLRTLHFRLNRGNISRKQPNDFDKLDGNKSVGVNNHDESNSKFNLDNNNIPSDRIKIPSSTSKVENNEVKFSYLSMQFI